MKAAEVKSGRVRLSTRHFLRIAHRDRWTCHVCEMGFMVNDPWEIDHDIPLARGPKRGGTNLLSNLKLCHRSCNRDKAAS